jgi:hypothetical protein
MAKPKYKNSKSKVKHVVKAKPKRDPRIEEIYEEIVTFTCPVRGLVTQKVKVKRFKPLGEQLEKHLVVSIGELVDQLEEKDDGLSIYSDGEELGISSIPTVEEID